MTAKVAEGELVYAIGDVHGRSDLLGGLLAAIEADAARHDASKKILVFVGDYIDRGPDSRGVMDMLLNDLPGGFSVHFLKGNHEALLLDFLDDANRLDPWRLNSGEETMASYGVDVQQLKETRARPEAWREAFKAKLPTAHADFFRHLGLQVSIGDYLFVHAGIRPGVPLDAQSETDLIWIRDEFLESTESFGKVVVHGHTPVRAPVIRPNRIGIDTGAVLSGRLTALKLENGDQSFLQT